MAPPKGQPKTIKSISGHARKPTAPAVPRTVVQPAIPFNLMPKTNPKTNKPAKPTPTATAFASASAPPANGFPVSSLEAALINEHGSVPDSSKPVQSAKTSAAENEVNGSNVEKPGYVAPNTNINTSIDTNTNINTNGNGNGNGAHQARDYDPQLQTNGTNGLNGAGIDSPAQARAQAPVQAQAPRHPHGTANEPAEPSSAPSVADVESTLGSVSANDPNQGAHDGNDGHLYHLSQPQSATSTSRPDLPPSFHPPTHPLQFQQSGEQFPDPTSFHAPHHMHHGHHHPQQRHMSNGGIMFGGFPDSHTPSPVPPPGGFMAPPPPPLPPVNGDNHIHHQTNGHHHAHSTSNGFPGHINTQFRPDMMPMSTIDTFGQVPAPVPQVPYEAFPPGLGRYGPPTPHSFHGSHASGEPNGMEGGAMPFPPSGPHYGGHPHHDHPVAHPHPPAHFPPFMHPEAFNRRPSAVEDDLMESVTYFRNQFDNGELADCVLELIYAKGRHHPVKITGHKLIMARSPALKRHIMAARATDLGNHTITLESDDAYLRSDAWWTAVQRLYLHPLLTLPPIMGNTNGMDFAGDKTDRFGFCLGYAAAGHVLQMQDVLIRGMHVAADLLNWNTIEEALAFVLEGATQRHTDYGLEQDEVVELDFPYGPEMKLLLAAAINFLVNEFPANFDLDTSVTDPPKLARIPGSATMSQSSGVASPAIARGTNMRSTSKPTNRLSSIKFGDLPAAYPEDGPLPQREPAQCSPVLSRILLNLPFDELRVVLTSESNGVSGWNTAQDRYHAVTQVVAEREARRLRAVDAVRSGSVPQAQEIQLRLLAHRRHAIVDHWDVLNWQEEVIQPRGTEIPRVVRTWIPQFNAAPEPPQQQLYQPMRDVHNSMV